MMQINSEPTRRQLMDQVEQQAKEIERLREALRKIADLEYEDLPAPKSANETVLWVCLNGCVTLAENALKWEE